MKPYNTIRLEDSPDKGDIHVEARKSSVGIYGGPGGDFRGSHQNKTNKRQTRRQLKRADKARTNKNISNEEA
jgi:hypothetical protein